MKKSFMRYFAPPVFEKEEEKTWSAYLLNATILTSMALIALIVIGNIIGGKTHPLLYIIDSIAFIILFLLRSFLLRGKITFSGISLVILIIVSITLAVANIGTIRTPTTSIFVPAIIIAGLLFGKKGLVGSSIASSISVLGLIFAENAGKLPIPDYSVNITQWFTYSTTFALTSVLSYFAYQSARQAIRESFKRKEIEAQRDATQEALHEIETNLRVFMENARGFGVYSTKLTNGETYEPQIAFASPSIEDILGIENPAKNANWFKNVHEDDRARIADAHHISRTSGKGFDETFRIYHPQKEEWRWIRAISSAVLLEDGSFTHFNGLIVDITDFKRVEEALRKSEKKFRDLFEKSDDAILILKEGKFIDCNQATLRMLGYEDKREILNLHPAELSPERQPDGKLSFEKAEEVMRFAKENGSHRFVWYHLRANGEVFPAEILLTVINLEGDEQIIYTTWKDITEQVKAEQALMESEEKYRSLIEQSNDVIYLLYQNHFEIINFRFTEVFGVTPEEATSPDFNFMDLVAPKSKKTILERMKKSELGEKLPQRYEFTAYDKNGNEIEMDVSVSYIAYKEGIATQGILRDITEQKRAEEALRKSEKSFRLLFEHSPLGTYIATPEGDIIDANNTLLDMLGSPSLEATREINILTFPPLIENGYADTYRKCVETGETSFSEFLYISKWQKNLFLSSYIIPLTDDRGKVEKIYTIMENITERKEAEIKLQKANEQLKAQLDEIKELEFALREQAIRDPLTGLFNRRYMEEMLDLELAKASRRGMPLSVVILDLDNLKQINDINGHIAGGDLALKKLADTLTQLCRAEDTICRYGGDEFLVMLYDTPVDAAYERTLQWKEAVSKVKIKAKDNEFGISFSAGVAAFPRDGLTSEEFLIHADDALYRAKELGRNRVVIH